MLKKVELKLEKSKTVELLVLDIIEPIVHIYLIQTAKSPDQLSHRPGLFTQT